MLYHQSLANVYLSNQDIYAEVKAMKTALKTLLTTVALSMSALIASSAMAAPQHDPRYNNQHAPQAHWNNKDNHKWNDDHRRNDDKRYNQRTVNPSRDWRVGQTLPRQYDSRGFKLSDRDARRLPNTGRNQQWYKVNGDYVLVNERNNKIIRIIN